VYDVAFHYIRDATWLQVSQVRVAKSLPERQSNTGRGYALVLGCGAAALPLWWRWTHGWQPAPIAARASWRPSAMQKSSGRLHFAFSKASHVLKQGPDLKTQKKGDRVKDGNGAFLKGQ
jgi:hypothetical protein